MFQFSQQIASQLKTHLFNNPPNPQPPSTSKPTSQFQLSPRRVTKKNSRLIRRMSSSLMGLFELCKLNTYSPPQIITILQENHEHSKDDISKLQTFLSNSQIFSDLKESNFDIQIINKLLISFIPYLRIETFNSNDCLCLYGSSPHKVFILLEGNIKIIKPINNDFYYNGFEYFNEIMKMKFLILYENNIKLNNEILLEKTISSNYHIFPFDKNELLLIKFIVFHEMYMKQIIKAFPHSSDNNENNNNNEQKELNVLLDLLKQCYLSQKDFNIKYPHTIAYLPYMKSAITSELNQRLNDDIINKYSFINDPMKKKVQIFSYSNTYLNIEGDLIGETSFDNGIVSSPKFTEYAFCFEKSFCVSIPFEIYFQNIHNEKEKIKTKEIAFLLQTHLLRPIHFRKFKRLYFHTFKLKQYHKGDYIINDGMVKLGKVYIVKEGEIQITIKKSMVHLIKIQKRMISILKENECKIENNIIYNEKEIMNKDDNYKVCTYKLISLGEKDVFGNGMVYYDVDNFYNVVVVSEKAKVYEVNKEDFIKMEEGDEDVKKRFRMFGIKKIKNLLDRINNILNYVLSSVSEKNEEDILQSNVNENEKEGNNESSNVNSGNNVIQMKMTRYSCCNDNSNGKGYGNVKMKAPFFSLTSKQLNRNVLCDNSPVRIGKSTTMKEYLSFTKKVYPSRNNFNFMETISSNSNNINNINNNNKHHYPFLSTFTIESTSEHKKYKPINYKKHTKSDFSKTHMYFEDKLLKYSKLLIQTSSFINDNTINKNYFESTFSSIGKDILSDNNKKQKMKSKSNQHKINIKKNNLMNIKISPYNTIKKTLTTSHNEQCSTIETKLPNINEMMNHSRQSYTIYNRNNKEHEDSISMEIKIEPKDLGIKGKKVKYNVNSMKICKNVLYKKVIGSKLGY